MADELNMEDINQDLKPQTNSEISLDAMISAPLVAASKANAEMMLGQTHFVLRNCFNKNKGNGYDPIMIEMSLVRSVIDNDKLPSDDDYMTLQEMRFKVPLLILIPINSLAIDNITVDFDMDVTSTETWNLTDDDLKNTGQRVLKKQAQLNGKVKGESTGQYAKDSSSKLKVHINASPLPLPLGLLSILELYSKNINPSTNDKPIEK